MAKVKADASAEGISFETEADDSALVPNPLIPGVPNWEIEELKSITDGHIILRPPVDEVWEWRVDPYRSLPRLGTDALHPALIAADAPKVRLKMMQGRDRRGASSGGSKGRERPEIGRFGPVLRRFRPISAWNLACAAGRTCCTTRRCLEVEPRSGEPRIGAAKTLDDKPGLELEFIVRASLGLRAKGLRSS